MSSAASSAAGRSLVHGASRLCTRCRLQARQHSSLSAIVSSRPLRLPSAFTQAHNQRRYLSRTAPQLGSDPKSEDASSSSSSSKRRTFYDFFPESLPSGPPPNGHFPIDTRLLRREFLAHQSRTHPDLHQDPAAKARAETASALLNDAYRTLSNPLLRAQYLLSLRGVDVAEDETLKVEEPDLLMMVLEAREEIEDAVDEEDLTIPREENEKRIRASEERLEVAFREDDVEAAKREAVRLRYWVNIRESLDNWEPGKPVVLQH